VIGVGGSGGALAIAVADRVLMMENSIYSVISPEGCAAIMWRDATKKELAAEAMRITARILASWAASMTSFPNLRAELTGITKPQPTC
jgi:acetyl-CoA carboxylase alpha subunit